MGTVVMKPSRRPRVTTQEQNALVKDYVTNPCNETADRLVAANLRLVYKIAQRYRCKSLTTEDLVQAGIIGLLEAAKKFEFHRNLAFSTMATHWVRQAIVREIEKTDRMVRLPVPTLAELKAVDRAEDELTRDLGRPPTEEEVAASAGIKPKRVSALRAIPDVVSSDTPIEGKNGEVLGIDLVPDSGVHVHNTALQNMGNEQLQRYLSRLKPRERYVVMSRYGVFGTPEKSLKELATEFGMSREGARHIEIRALRKLRQYVQESNDF